MTPQEKAELLGKSDHDLLIETTIKVDFIHEQIGEMKESMKWASRAAAVAVLSAALSIAGSVIAYALMH